MLQNFFTRVDKSRQIQKKLPKSDTLFFQKKLLHPKVPSLSKVEWEYNKSVMGFYWNIPRKLSRIPLLP